MTDVAGARIRVVVVDDHALIRAGVAALLGSLDDLQLVGEAEDGAAALEVIAATEPDVVVMDLHMGPTSGDSDLDGITATRLIGHRHPSVAVLVLTMIDDDDSLAAAVDAGAAGYVLKASTTDQLPNAIRTVAAGGSVFGANMAERLLRWRTAPSAPVFPQLTDREREVLTFAAQGDTNHAIARRLSISPRTVANHMSNVLTKLPATDRTDAVLQARAAGLRAGST